VGLYISETGNSGRLWVIKDISNTGKDININYVIKMLKSVRPCKSVFCTLFKSNLRYFNKI